MERLDGNALGGMLYELFGVEMTMATSVCAGCGAHELVARLDVYMRAPGAVARCPHCEAVMLRIVEGEGRVWIDLSGASAIEFAL